MHFPVSSVLSQKFAYKVFLMPAVFSQPRWGRKIVAQGASPGGGPSPRPASAGHPSPARAGEGTGVREGSPPHGLRRGLHSFARSAG